MDIDQALERYVVQLQADGRVASTIDQVRRYVGLLARWLREQGQPTDVRAITHEHLARFLASDTVGQRHDGRPRRATSANVLRSKLKSFFSYVAAAGYAERNAAALVRRAKCGPPPPRTLPPADCRRLLASLARHKDPLGRRDHALFSLLLGAGLRIGSAVALRIEDLDFDAGVAWLRRMKGDSPQQVLLAPGVARTLRAFLGRRREGPVFESGPGMAIDVRQARRRLTQALEAAGIKRRATPHSLRHAFAIDLLTRTQNLRLVQKAMHHASIASTCAYAAVADDAVRRALASAG
jgi:integrase/recombinase XerC